MKKIILKISIFSSSSSFIINIFFHKNTNGILIPTEKHFADIRNGIVRTIVWVVRQKGIRASKSEWKGEVIFELLGNYTTHNCRSY